MMLLVILASILPTLLLWLPFFLGIPQIMGIPIASDGGMSTVVRNYDGPLYIVVAKTFYNTALIKQNYSFDLPVEYYAAHFPLYPSLMRVVATLTHLGYPYSMLLITLLSSVFALFFFYKLAQLYEDKTDALWLMLIFAVFPARWLVVRSVGSPEPLFVGTILASFFFFKKKKYWLAGIFGALAQFTKSPAILLFVAYLACILLPPLKHAAQTSLTNILKKFEWKSYPVLLIPLALCGVFLIFSQTYQDFFAYFHSGDNIHLFFPPFQIFNYTQPWVGTFWLEEIIFVYLFVLLGIMYLLKQKEYQMLSFVGIFFATIIFVSHRDLIRYSLPIVPFLLIAFRKILLQKEFKFILVFLLVPIYLFSLAYISQNHMQISDWAPLL